MSGFHTLKLHAPEHDALLTVPDVVNFPEICDDVVDRVVCDMNKVGFAELPGYVTAEQLATMQEFVLAATTKAGNQYVGFAGYDSLMGTIFAAISDNPTFLNLLHTIYARGTGKPGPDAPLYQVLRCLSGETGKAHSLIFHYDSYVVTALFPVLIPTEGKTGDLIMLPNTRKLRSSYMGNLVDKLLLDNKATQKLLQLLHKMNILPHVRVKMKPGSVYFFWGYRSIHANESCSPQQVRATAIFHYANPHANSNIRAQIRALLPR